MKQTEVSIFVVISILFTIASGFPAADENEPHCKLKRISDKLALENTLEPRPELDLDNLQIPDPLIIKDQTITYNDQSYSFKDGRVAGLSTLDYDFNYDRDTSNFNLNATLDFVSLTGNYELKNGFVNLPLIGKHTFSGSGLVNASIAGLKLVMEIGIDTDEQSHFVTVRSLTIGDGFVEAGLKIENLLVDGAPVPVDLHLNWDDIQPQSNEPLIWRIMDSKDELVKEINRMLMGCSILDVIGLLGP
ncbi:hypothetical protein Ocin01_06138 [Orchesella cincta]|uniref:Uncharacterized protein n=1 Tax=Orchesella cincta TaxID=48709 RepID=A0A1D2N5N2_ORCCI|nr:hypothetical protein Ocin01_06138 [Orchesella cincta]